MAGDAPVGGHESSRRGRPGGGTAGESGAPAGGAPNSSAEGDAGGAPGERREPDVPAGSGPDAPTHLRFLVLASAALVAVALAAGLFPDLAWLVWLLVAVAMGQGVLAGAAWRDFWRGPPSRAVFGAGGRFGGFVAAVAFSAVEAHAVGSGMAGGAPRAAVAMLAPPMLVAAVALRSAVKHRRRDRSTSDKSEGRW